MAGGDKKLHVVMFPWLAFGHMMPYLELAKFIAQKGHKISFVSTPRNIQRLPKPPPNSAPPLHFVELTLPRVDELPVNAEASCDIRGSDDLPYLSKAYDGLQTQLTQFLESSSPDWIIFDFAAHWLPPIAGRLGISRAFFSTINACFIAITAGPTTNFVGSTTIGPVEQLTVPSKWIPFPTKVAYRSYDAQKILLAAASVNNAFGVSVFSRVGSVISGCDVIAIRHCREFEPDWLTLLEDQLHPKPVIPVGLFPPSVHLREHDQQANVVRWLSISEWLNKQTKGSVVYVAFGSEVTLSREELTELALGLELSGSPFFWVLKKPLGSGNSNSLELPDGFEERTRSRGVVWTSWAPQLRILSHESIGGFFTHCGWSSVIEGLEFGRPLIMLPFLADQPLNARVLEDNKVGIEIPRDERDGSYTRNSVAESIKLVMVGNEIYRHKAIEMSGIFGDKVLHDQYLDNFVEYLQKH